MSKTDITKPALTSITATQAKQAQSYIKAATSDNTRKAYRSAIKQFEKWGGRLPTNRDTLLNYLIEKADSLNSRTLDLHLTAVGQWHFYQGLPDPARDASVRKAMEGIRRKHGKPKQKAKALQLEHIATMVQHLNQLPDTLKKHRDIALILTCFFGAFRRSELAAIQVKDLRFEQEGLIIQLPKSKTDQSGKGMLRALPFGPELVCPATAIKTWLDAAKIEDGYLFRGINRWQHLNEKPLNPGSINILLKGIGGQCGFEFTDELSSHSFRRGLSTSAAREKIDFELIKKQGGWKSDATVWSYIEEGQQFQENAANSLMDKVAELLKDAQAV